MNPIEHALRHVDRYQQQHPWLAVPFALVRKFGDDKGGELATLLTYNAFFALLPLLLLLAQRSPCMPPRSTSSAPAACGHAACCSHRSPDPTSEP